MTILEPASRFSLGAQSQQSVQERTGKTIGLLNAYSTRNLGDSAIMSAIAGLCGEHQVVASVRDASPLPVAGVELRSGLDRCNAFVSVGGDIFNNARPWFVTRSFLRNVTELRNRASRTIVFGQTIPSSCKGLGLALLARALSQTSAVVVRDAESARVLKRHGVDAVLSYDVAFSLNDCPCAVARARTLYDQSGLDPDRTALISVRGFDSLYPHDSSLFQVRMARLAQRLLARGHQVAVLIQSDAGRNDSDREIAEKLIEGVPGLRIVDLFANPHDEDRVATLMSVIAQANIVVAVRYHTAVLRLAAGRHAYHLHYSRKGQDLSNRLGLDGCSLGSFEPDQALDAIEYSADRIFDVAPVARHVRQSFAQAFEMLWR